MPGLSLSYRANEATRRNRRLRWQEFSMLHEFPPSVISCPLACPLWQVMCLHLCPKTVYMPSAHRSPRLFYCKRARISSREVNANGIPFQTSVHDQNVDLENRADAPSRFHMLIISPATFILLLIVNLFLLLVYIAGYQFESNGSRKTVSFDFVTQSFDPINILSSKFSLGYSCSFFSTKGTTSANSSIDLRRLYLDSAPLARIPRLRFASDTQ